MRRSGLMVRMGALFVVAGPLMAPPAFADDGNTCLNSFGDEAIAACTRVINSRQWRGHNLAIAYNNRGFEYSKKGDEDRALADYNESIRLDPRYGMPHNNRGNIYYSTGDGDRALADYDEAIRLNPKLTYAYNGRGSVYSDRGDADRALAEFDEAVQLDPNDAYARNGRGFAYHTKGDQDRALADYDEAIRLDPKYAIAHNNRGNLYYGKGDLDRAFADYDEAIRLDPKMAYAYDGRGEVYYSKGDMDRALADCNEAIRLNPEFSIVYYDRGNVYAVKGDNDRALADYDETIRRDPKLAKAYNQRGNIYYAKGDNDRAVVDYSEAIRLDPNMVFAYSTRGDIYSTRADKIHALADFQAVLRLTRASDSLNQQAASKIAALQASPAVAVAPPVAGAERRVALVIGNSAYRAVQLLPNPAKDADLIGAALRGAGVEDVTIVHDLDREGMVAALKAFARKADSADWAVVYYAGHGIEVGGVNYLIPIDAKLETDRDVPDEAISLERMMSAMEGAHKLKLVVLDACRTNPFASHMKMTVAHRAIGRGFARVEPEGATLVVYAAKEGTTAEDGDADSPFALSFAKRIVEPGVEINKALRFVRQDVLETTGNHQEPFVYGSLPPDDFYFVPPK